MSTVNIVKYYFYKGMMPEDPARLRQMVALAYRTARDKKLYPKAVLIRSNEHDTTSINGRHQKDPLGWHVTLCYKDEAQLASGTHVACHGYVAGKDNLDFTGATHAGQKADSVGKKNGLPVWPSEDDLDVAPEIGYGHLDSESG